MKKLLWLAVFCLVSCGSKQVKVLDATWTSMKHPMPPAPEQKLVRVANVETEYCVDSWTGTYGLMDEAVKKAERDYDIDYIKFPSFSQSMGKRCAQVTGEGFRMVR